VKLIQTTTLGASALNITFTSIPADYTDLVALISGRTDRAAVDDGLIIRFNSDNTSGNYAARRLWGIGNTENADASYAFFAFSGATANANTFGSTQVYFPNYTSTIAKSFFGDGGGVGGNTSNPMGIVGARWTGTAAITSIAFTAATGPNLVSGTTISLYGITKGSDGIVTTSP
jgi:hypothetical protein